MHTFKRSKEEGRVKESIQPSTIFLTRDTKWGSDRNIRKRNTQESQEASPFPAGDYKAARNRQDSNKTHKYNEKDP